AAETFYRIAEPLWWRTPCLCCPASPHRARCLHRIPARLPRFVPCRVGAADRQPMQAHIDSDRPRTRCSREHADELHDQIGLDPPKPPIPTLAEYMAATTKAWSDR